MIVPTIARIVHYYADKGSYESRGPLAAIVAGLRKVADDYRLVLTVCGSDGTTFPAHNVLLIQGDQEISFPCAMWMPYQVGQAARTEQAEHTARQVLDSQRATSKPVLNERNPPYAPNATVIEVGAIASQDGGNTPPAFIGTLNEAVAGLKGPHISADDVNNAIQFVQFYIIGGRTTICEITLQNGFTVRGEATVLKMANFKLEVGKSLSYQDAWKKIWALEAYALADRLFDKGEG